MDWRTGAIQDLETNYLLNVPYHHKDMRIKYTSIFVDDQHKALKFYTEILGFVKKADIKANNYWWLTVISPEDQDGVVLVLEPNENPAAKAYQEAIFKQGISVNMFFVDDVQKEYERLKKLGVSFTKEPTKLPGIGTTIAILDDTCGNLVQITKLNS